MIKFNYDVMNILNRIWKSGFEAYIVGGAVRDYLLGNVPLDYDITTSAFADDIKKIFYDCKCFMTGKKFGTVSLIYNNKTYEITTYRIDGKYLNNRHPIDVQFTHLLCEDLKRRDFTINALAYYDEFVDLFNGRGDLDNKIIRCIGNANEKMEEDAIRILRALRFCSKLTFNIEEKTKEAIFLNKHLLKNIAIERVNKELFELFEYDKCYQIIDKYFEVFNIIFDFINENQKDEIITKIKNVNTNYVLTYASFFSFVNQNDFETIIKKYKLPNKIVDIIRFVNYKKIILENNIVECKKILKNCRFSDIILYVSYNCFDAFQKNKYIELFTKAYESCHKIKDLQINGNDLLDIGIKHEKINTYLTEILDLVIEGKLSNERQYLLDYIKGK